MSRPSPNLYMRPFPNSGEKYLHSAVIDMANHILPSSASSVPRPPIETFSSAVIDTVNGFAYFGLSGGAFFSHADSVVRIDLRSTTTIISSQNPSMYGESVTFTAMVSDNDNPLTGTVAFKDGGTTIVGCNMQPLNESGQATCIPPTLAAGLHTITAEYSGDANCRGSTGSLLQFVSTSRTYLPFISK